MSIQPHDIEALNSARIIDKFFEWARVGRQTLKQEAAGDEPCRPSDIIRAAEKEHP